jgi:site-specific DNA-methyltransferase (adenine-specific)
MFPFVVIVKVSPVNLLLATFSFHVPSHDDPAAKHGAATSANAAHTQYSLLFIATSDTDLCSEPEPNRSTRPESTVVQTVDVQLYEIREVHQCRSKAPPKSSTYISVFFPSSIASHPRYTRIMPRSGPASISTCPAGEIHLGDNLPILQSLPSASVDLIYIDPPFNTGATQKRTRITARRTSADSANGTRNGFGGARYETTTVASPTYADTFDDYLAFLRPRLLEAHRLLTPTGSLFLHLDPRESHYAKVMLDQIFGRDCFRNEIIWAYDYGGKPRDRWPAKHDNLLWYSRSPTAYTFHYDAIDRIPYMAPSLVGPEKAARGKIPTDVWWITVVPTNSREKTGYPTQKPLKLLERIVRVHSSPGDLVLDFFAGSGTTGQAAANLGRRFLLIDSSPEAITIMRQRLGTR